MATGLKPCHVCGATRGLYVLEDYKDFEWFVFCDNCKASVHSENAQTKEEAIEIWNTRYERTTTIDEDCCCDWCETPLVNYDCYGEGFVDQFCSGCGARIIH